MASKKIYVGLGVVLFAVIAFLFVGRVAAGSSLPGQPLYSLGRVYEGVELTFAGWIGGTLARAEVHLEHAEKRIEDIASIVDGKDDSVLSLLGHAYAQEELEEAEETELTEEEIELIGELTEDYEESMGNAILEVEKAQEDGLDTDEVSELVVNATFVHQEALAGVLAKVPEQAQASIQRAMQMGAEAQGRAVDAISGERQEAVMEMVEEKRQQAEEFRPDNPGGENGIDLDDIPGGNPEVEAPAGQPDDVPSGQPNDIPGGNPEVEAPAGQPNDIPAGR